MPSTDIAHCGACAGRMILVSRPDEHWFICLECGTTTDPRPTAAAAADDVVWAPARRRAPAKPDPSSVVSRQSSKPTSLPNT
jgi:hypothetical protein